MRVICLLLLSALLVTLSSCAEETADTGALLTRLEGVVGARGSVQAVEATSAHEGDGLLVTVRAVELGGSAEDALLKLCADVEGSVWSDGRAATDFVEVSAEGSGAQIDVLLLAERASEVDWASVGPREVPYLRVDYEGP